MPMFRTLPWRLTDAERLNGYEWGGDAILAAAAWRVVEPGGTGRPKLAGWGQWQDTKDTSHEPTLGSDNCKACVTVPKEFASIEVFRIKGEWHYIVDHHRPEMLNFVSRKFPKYENLDLAKLAGKKPSCAVIPSTLEFAEAQRKAAEAEAEAHRKAEEVAVEAQRKAKEAREQHLKDLQAAVVRSKEPQTELEKKTQADGFWTDQKTGLTWAAKSSFTGAFRACTDVGTGSDWRVADLYELESLSDPAQSHEFIYESTMILHYHIAGGIMLSDSVIWTSLVGLPATSAAGSHCQRKVEMSYSPQSRNVLFWPG